MKTKEYITRLANDIRECNKRYRLGRPIVSDAKYDSMVQELRELDPNNEWLKKVEPSPVSGSRKMTLPIPMKSLNKVKDVGELLQWANSLSLPPKMRLVVMPKYDGISWLHNESTGMTYSRGGSENEGQDCSIHYIRGKFKNIKDRNRLPVNYTFGELVFARDKWEKEMAGKRSDSTGEVYKSPRNTVAGFINRDIPPEEICHAEFMRYGVDASSLNNWIYFSDLLSVLSIEFNQFIGNEMPFKTVTLDNINKEMLDDLYIKWRQAYYIDGLVIYIDDLNLWDTIGRHQTTENPLYAIAYKHPDFTESFETVVKGISWQVSKSGALKPVVHINAVDTGDCTMENPTGYNAGWCRDNNIGIGAKILVTRSGGVIPKILKTLKPGYNHTPQMCHHCGSEVKFDEKGIELYCTNPDCWGRRLAKVIHFFTTVGVENLGEETFTKIFHAGHETVRDIINITWDQLMEIEGFGEATANTVLSQMRKIQKGVDLAVMIHASDCFKGIGKIKAQNFIDRMDDEDLAYFMQGQYFLMHEMNPESPSFQKASITSQNLRLGYLPFMNFLENTGIPVLLPNKQELEGDRCVGFSVCFSGVRDAALEGKIVANGGVIVSGVSKKTTHLIVKDLSDTSSKISKAKQLGIPIVSVQEFKACI